MAMAPLHATNYLLENIYTDATHNPEPGPHQVPNPGLRNLYQHNEVRPISVAQVLASQGVSTVAQFALQFGDSPEAARAKEAAEPRPRRRRERRRPALPGKMARVHVFWPHLSISVPLRTPP